MIIQGVYELEYPNGVRQVKHLISAENWHTQVKPILNSISDEKELPEKQQNRDLLKKLNNQLKELIGDIDVFYELIVEGGRHHSAVVRSGILPPFFNGDIERTVKIKEL
jgi:hypothetical protein